MPDTTPPFVETPGNPKPTDLEGGWLTLRDKRRLRYATARPRGPARGTVLLLQGRNEAIEKYFETINDLTARGFCVATFDWRGQGGSDRMSSDPAKGHVASMKVYARDLEEVVREVLPECPRPCVVLAHSMGGLVALSAIPRLTDRVERLVLSAPLMAFKGLPSAIGLLSFTSRLLRLVGLGRTPMRSVNRNRSRHSLSRNPLTTDPHRLRRNQTLADHAPQLFVPKLTASWFAACFAAIRRLEDSDVIAGLHLPTLVVTAGDDKVVESAASERLAWRMRSGHFITIPGARHELLQEADVYREQLLAAFEGFVGSVMPVAIETPDLPEGFDSEIDRAAASAVQAPGPEPEPRPEGASVSG